jgi:hypothetical protein
MLIARFAFGYDAGLLGEKSHGNFDGMTAMYRVGVASSTGKNDTASLD